MKAARLGEASSPLRAADFTRRAKLATSSSRSRARWIRSSPDVISTGARDALSGVERDFFDARQHVMHALVERAGQHGVGDNRVQALQVGHPRQQIPIGGEQTVRIECAIGDGHDDVPIRSRRRGGRQPCATGVFVLTVLGDATLEFTKCRREKTGLADQAFGARSVGAPGSSRYNARRSKSSTLFRRRRSSS